VAVVQPIIFKFTANTTIGNSAIYETIGNIGIGIAGPYKKLSVVPATGGDGIAVVNNAGNPKVLMSASGIEGNG
jgi:hypothetical protein